MKDIFRCGKTKRIYFQQTYSERIAEGTYLYDDGPVRI